MLIATHSWSHFFFLMNKMERVSRKEEDDVNLFQGSILKKWGFYLCVSNDLQNCTVTFIQLESIQFFFFSNVGFLIQSPVLSLNIVLFNFNHPMHNINTFLLFLLKMSISRTQGSKNILEGLLMEKAHSSLHPFVQELTLTHVSPTKSFRLVLQSPATSKQWFSCSCTSSDIVMTFYRCDPYFVESLLTWILDYLNQ
jgi:hypothetical protein